MDRRNFLAIIPSLSAIPFIGKDIVKKSDRIEIFQPEQMEKEINNVHEECVVQVVKNGRVLATGYIKELNIESPLIDVSCRDNNGAITYAHGYTDIEIRCGLYPPITNDLMNAAHDITSGFQRHIAARLTEG